MGRILTWWLIEHGSLIFSVSYVFACDVSVQQIFENL